MIGHSFPTLEKLPYIPTMLHNRTQLPRRGPAPTCSSWQRPRLVPRVLRPGCPAGRSRRSAAPAAAPAAGAGQGADRRPPAGDRPPRPNGSSTWRSRSSPRSSRSRPTWSKTSRCSTRNSRSRAATSRPHHRGSTCKLTVSRPARLRRARCSRSATARRSGITSRSSNRRSYRKLSIKPILERLNSPELDPKIRDQAMTQMGFAGPETLLVGLAQVGQVRPEGRSDARRQDGLDAPRNLAEPQGPGRPRPAPAPPTGPLPALHPQHWPRSIWARTTAGPTS